MLESERSLWLMSAMGSRGLIGGDLGVLSDCRASELLGFEDKGVGEGRDEEEEEKEYEGVRSA